MPNPNLAVAGLTEIAPGVYAPDQVRDTVSNKIHAVVSDGPSIAQQQATLLGLGFAGGIDASGGVMFGGGGGGTMGLGVVEKFE